MKLNKKTIMISIVILALTMTVVGFSGCQKNDNKTNNNQEQNQITLSKEESKRLKEEFENFIKEYGEKVELEKVDTTGWKIYTDKKRGFSFKYPNDWAVIKKEIPQHKIYKDCYDALGDYGGCRDYNLKAMKYQDVFLCLHPQEQNDNNEECYVKFEQWTPQAKTMSSMQYMLSEYYKHAEELIGKDNLNEKYTFSDNKVFVKMEHAYRSALFEPTKYVVNIDNSKAQWNDSSVSQKTNPDVFSYYHDDVFSSYNHNEKDYYIQVRKEFEKPFFGIVNSLEVQEKE